MNGLTRSEQKILKAVERQSKYLNQTKNEPYEKLVNDELGRCLTPQEINAVKIFVQYGNAVSPSDKYYDNAVRSVIVSGDISNVLRFAQHDVAWLERIRQMEIQTKSRLERLER